MMFTDINEAISHARALRQSNAGRHYSLKQKRNGRIVVCKAGLVSAPMWSTKNDLVRGEIYAFYAKGLSPIFADGTIIVKVLEGMPGDRAKVTLDETTINGVSVGKGLQVASQHGIDPQKYVREGEIGEGRYWFFGRTPDSFDSRYWGSASTDQIIGKAYPIW